ncbi:MAG: hypothetical protein HYX68_25370 [Planctomycetes bacterium]|jgi:hypothetical protein|nr:hypothetical protein [Planctomycetota bacterium]
MHPLTSLNVERLEDRNQPSTITVNEFWIVYTAKTGVDNSVTVAPSLMGPGNHKFGGPIGINALAQDMANLKVKRVGPEAHTRAKFSVSQKRKLQGL